MGVSLAAVGAAVYPVVGPILEVRQLSKLSGEEVEAAVRPREPMQNDDGAGIVKLTGEDALLDWPNAMGPGKVPPIIPEFPGGLTVMNAHVRPSGGSCSLPLSPKLNPNRYLPAEAQELL